MGPSMPKKLAGHCALRDWDAIYVIGSASDILEVFMFNVTTMTWSTFASKGDTPNARRDFACAFSEDKNQIYVTGGHQTLTGTTVNDFFAFNITQRSWSKLTSMLQPRCGHVMTSYKDQPTVVGGVDEAGESLLSLEYFNDLTWDLRDEKLSSGRKNFGVTRVPTNLLPPQS
jgi:N-acetylneuraminic acid mutarotase